MSGRLTRAQFRARRQAGENIELHPPTLPRIKRRRRVSPQILFINPVAHSTLSQNTQNTMNNINISRPKPNFKIKFDDLPESLQNATRQVRNQNPDIDAEDMNEIFETEYVMYNLGQNPFQHFVKIPLADIVPILQEIALTLCQWNINEWRQAEKQKIAQSMMEAALDLIFLQWSEIFPYRAVPYLQSIAYHHTTQLNTMYQNMLNICYLHHLQSPLSMAMGNNEEVINAMSQINLNNPNPNGLNNVPTTSQWTPTNNQQVQNNVANNNMPQTLNETSQEPPSITNAPNHVQSNMNGQIPVNNGPHTQDFSIPPFLTSIPTNFSVPPPNINTSNAPNNAQHNIRNNSSSGGNTTINNNNHQDMDWEDNSLNTQHLNPNSQNQTDHRYSPMRRRANAGTNSNDVSNESRRKFDDTELKIANTIKSWPNKFDGTHGHFQQYAEIWLSRSNNDISPQKILSNIEYLLEGEALKWHKTFGINISNWQTYGNQMQAYLNRGKNDNEIEADFNDGRHNQKKNENFITYYTRIKALSNKIKNVLPEMKLFERVKRGLHADYFLCKITANSINDLMAKCNEYEATLSMTRKTESNPTYNPYSFVHERNNSDQAQRFRPPMNTQKNYSHPSTSKEQHTNQKIDFRSRFWSNKNPNTPKNNMNAMAEESTDSESDDPENTRGNPRELTDEDRQYLEIAETETLNLIQHTNMSANEFRQQQSKQKCQNCHLRGHTIDQCQLAKHNVWFEHCKKCGTVNVTINNCPKCSKN